MKTTSLFILALAIFLIKCTPAPIAITIKDAEPQIAVSSTALDSKTVMVIASYSIFSLTNLNYSGNGYSPAIPNGILVDSALVTISDGAKIDTLEKVYPGVYLNTGFNLKTGLQYLLTVNDTLKKRKVVANTTYFDAAAANEILPVVTKKTTDTTIQLKMVLSDNAATINYYVMAYDRINPSKVPSPVNSANFSIVNIDAVKKIEVFSSAEAVNGTITKTFDIIDIHATDTLFVHYGKIDRGYFNYLSSYKKTGSLINQITAEPITLPTNIVTGLGYFALYNVQRTVFDLKKY
ncbi:MAG: DUF4249 family protein [Ferruginibacter sp.]|nr:DUF4249 family protein [Ferruginibacter sp.]